MKVIGFLIASLMTTVALAAPSQAEVNTRALEILLANSGKMMTEDKTTAASVLSKLMTAKEGRTVKISNSCFYDKTDEAHQCKIVILDSDDKGRTDTEMTTIYYSLEKGANGMPSSNVMYLSIAVEQAG